MFVGRNDVGNIADNEKVARFGAENYRRIDPGVTAGDDQNLGRLSFLRKPAIKFGVVDKIFLAERAVSGEQAADFGHLSNLLLIKSAEII